MKKLLFVSTLLLASGCKGHSGDVTPGANPIAIWDGTFDGSPATLELQKTGDHVRGSFRETGTTENVVGFDEGTAITLTGPGLNVTFTKRSGGALDATSGGTGTLTPFNG